MFVWKLSFPLGQFRVLLKSYLESKVRFENYMKREKEENEVAYRCDVIFRYYIWIEN